MRTALVGRDRELGVLLGCLDESQRGRANLVVCVGEPGIGKTRLVEELTGQARDRGVLTAWGRTASTDGAPPYWPWREVLRALETAGLATQGTLADVAASGVEPSLEERVRRFDEVARLVLGAARSRPLLVVLDDVDGADEASQLLVQYLARTARDDPLLVVVCCRDTAGPLAALAQEPNTTQVELRGLERAAVGEQVSGIVGRAASDAELAAVYNATAGNPFFVGELARQLADGSTLPGAVPRSVLDAIGQRLGQLSADCAASLRAASLLGTRFAVPLVAAMTGSERGRLPYVAGRGGTRRAGPRGRGAGGAAVRPWPGPGRDRRRSGQRAAGHAAPSCGRGDRGPGGAYRGDGLRPGAPLGGDGDRR